LTEKRTASTVHQRKDQRGGTIKKKTGALPRAKKETSFFSKGGRLGSRREERPNKRKPNKIFRGRRKKRCKKKKRGNASDEKKLRKRGRKSTGRRGGEGLGRQVVQQSSKKKKRGGQCQSWGKHKPSEEKTTRWGATIKVRKNRISRVQKGRLIQSAKGGEKKRRASFGRKKLSQSKEKEEKNERESGERGSAKQKSQLRGKRTEKKSIEVENVGGLRKKSAPLVGREKNKPSWRGKKRFQQSK